MITINKHSSIRIAGEKILYFDPYEIIETPFEGVSLHEANGITGPHDADIIFITHKHYDHFDPDSIRALMNPSTILVAPESIREDVLGAGFGDIHGGESSDDSNNVDSFEDWCEFLAPYEEAEIDGIKVEAVPSYNINKPNHLKEFGWLGYIVTMDGALNDGNFADDSEKISAIRYYVAGDTDDNEDIRKVHCDVALVPVGGTYTMDVAEAATFASSIKSKVAIPTHYGSIVGNKNCGEKFKKALAKLDSEIEVRVLI